jgi:hypothetical protein
LTGGLCLVGIEPYAQTPGAIRPHTPVPAGGRAQQEGRNVGRVTARSAEQHNMEREQRAIPGAAKHPMYLGLLC